ncbi:uncharacterized protein N7511_001220 [Penicillium nucicola]|uniref:uncharacterized protein n=1 Tax=Penicillium nucicola TaxID=1850975 RepID=UPI00254544EB|nr:uncharacterized protein N7511_001220 [Penicillium nucicola]KAJ5776209.1 hypothetical protein N7511_001220 [Penicillium nucicola]
MESSEQIHPLLVKRPRSADVDAETFSFAKPASHEKLFSLRKLPNKTLLSQSTVCNAQLSKEQTRLEGSFNGQLAKLNATPECRTITDAPTFAFQTPARKPLLFQPPRRLSISKEQRKESARTGDSVCARESGFQHEQDHSLIRQNEAAQTDDSVNTRIAETNVTIPESSPIPIDENTNEAVPVLSVSNRPGKNSEDTSKNVSSGMPLKVMGNQPRVSEQRCTKQKKPSTKRLTPPFLKKSSTQLGEDDLFELLIVKMREREENEQNSANVRQQIEIENSHLKSEIHSLHDRLKSYQAQLVRSSSDANIQREQINKWKARLAKFKDVIIDLGLQYDTLRGQSNNLKSITSGLQKEKADIQQALDEIKVQVNKSTDTIEGQRNKLHSSEEKIAMLSEALARSDRQDESMKLQLSHEKKRVVTLESYIKNESQSQARCLAIVKKSQSEIIERLDSASKLVATACVDSRDAVTSAIGPVLERCVSSVCELKEQCGIQRMDIEKFTGDVREAGSRVDMLAGQLARGIETNKDVSNGLSRALQEGLQTIEKSLGPDSVLSNQLANSETHYEHLQGSLEVVGPVISSLNASVKAMRATETDLVHGLEIFDQRLADSQFPAGNPVLEMEISTKFAENTQLQLELQKVSLDLESLREQHGKITSENEYLQHALTEAITNEQSSKSQNSRLEIEKTALRGELQLVEQRIRDDLRIASTKAQDRLKADFEKEIQRLEIANSEMKTYSDQLKSQVSDAQRSLAETEKTADTEQQIKVIMLKQLERRIEELNATCSNYLAEAKANDIELQRLKSCEAGLKVDKEKLFGELKEAEEKIHAAEASLALNTTIESERLRISGDMQQRLKALEIELAERTEELKASLVLRTKSDAQTVETAQKVEAKIKVLELETTQKTEELAKVNETLEMMKSRSLALEKVGEEADSEIVALLRRAQEAESWQATIREGFARIMEMHSDEPFEQTWQKVEKILQSSPNQRPFTIVSSGANLSGSARVHPADNKRLDFGPREGRANEALETDQQTERVCETIANSQTDLPLSQRTQNACKPLIRNSIEWLSKSSLDVGHIVPFASLHDKLLREDSLSLFNDPAELEMLFMSTPDFQGPGDPSKLPRASPKRKETSPKPGSVDLNDNSSNSAIGKHVRRVDDCKSERSNSDLRKLDDPGLNTTMNIEQSSIKRKVVSFEGSRQTETDRPQQMSDAINVSSGQGFEDKVPKRAQKRTYSRLRQSVAQEENSMEAHVQPGDIAMAATPQPAINVKDTDARPANPAKRARNSAADPERRLSPKGLASGSSKVNTTVTRARTRRTTRGDRYNQRFRQNT